MANKNMMAMSFPVTGRRFAGLLLSVVAMTSACEEQRADQPSARPSTGSSQILARVGDQSISVADLERAIRSMPRPAQLEYVSAPQRRELLESLIDRKLMARQARAEGLAEAGQPGETPAGAGGDPFELERLLAEAWMEKRLAEVVVSPSAIEAYYRANQAKYSVPARIKVSRAVGADPGVARRFATLLEDEADIATLKANAASRGQVSEVWLQDVEPLGPMEKIAVVLEPGEVSEVFDVAGGYAVLRVEEKAAASLHPLSDVRSGIAARLNQQARSSIRKELLTGLRQTATVFVDKDALELYQWQP